MPGEKKAIHKQISFRGFAIALIAQIPDSLQMQNLMTVIKRFWRIYKQQITVNRTRSANLLKARP